MDSKKADTDSKKIDANLWINRFFFVNYLLMLINVAGFMLLNEGSGIIAALFSVAVTIAYALVYLIPAGIIISVAKTLTKLLRIWDKTYARIFIYSVSILTLTLSHLVILVDRTIFKMYGFHFNGFVWNILTTKGGFESLGFDHGAYWVATGATAGFIIAEILILIVCIKWNNFKVSRTSKLPHYLRISMPYIAGLMFIAQGISFGFSSYSGCSSILVRSYTVPFYLPITFKSVLRDLGFKPSEKNVLTAKQNKNLALNYPLKEIKQRPDSTKYNIVWLVAESLRADMLNPEVMPQTYKFAQKGQWFLNHYSGGNGTRKALFSMFYGLYGNYWDAFLNEQRSPVVMDLLQNNGYQIDLYTSARFTYPEFDKTLFSKIPKKQLHEQPTGVGWKSDRENVAKMLKFISTRDKNTPFMSFLFFESPHARYYFPPECAIRKNYLKDFNYATADIAKDIDLIHNRYINSCYHLDTQLARIIDYLEKEKLLDTTIVIITGDHGEEFMEHGRWGHNSAFVEQQVRTPMIICVPGMKPKQYTKMTSHLDISPTVMHLLGVENPSEDFSLGIDMLSDKERKYTIISDWDSLAYRDDKYKIVLPLKASALGNVITTANDEKVEDSSIVYSQEQKNLIQVLSDSGKFTKKH